MWRQKLGGEAATFLIPAISTKPLTIPATALTWSGGAMVSFLPARDSAVTAARVLTEAAPPVLSRRATTRSRAAPLWPTAAGFESMP